MDVFINKFKELKVDYLLHEVCHSKKWRIKDFPKGISLNFSSKLFKSRNNFNKSNYQFPTWFFFNKKYDLKIKILFFWKYKKTQRNISFTIDTLNDLSNVKKFIKVNKCELENNFINFCNSL